MVDDPDDDPAGTLQFDFSALGLVTIHELTTIDIEDDGSNVQCLRDETVIKTVPLTAGNGGGVNVVSLDCQGVDTMVVNLKEGAAIDHISFQPKTDLQNVILFVGDGMGPVQVAIASHTLTFEGLSPGAIVSEAFIGNGMGPIGVRGINPNLGGSVNAAVIFDSSCSPGGAPSDCSGGIQISLLLLKVNIFAI